MSEAGEQHGGGSGRSIGERIEQMRAASFAASRRGYDRDEVHTYLNALADWLETLGLDGSDHGELRRELAWVGERTSEILTKAEETARELRESGAAEAERMRAEAEQLRAEAEQEARRTRLEASAAADQTTAEAERRAEQILAEAAARRRDLQTLIGDLEERRDEIIADGNRLVDELAELFASAEDEEEPSAEDEDEAQAEAEADVEAEVDAEVFDDADSDTEERSIPSR